MPLCTEPAKDCVRRMLVRDPRKRATANEILKHDWMRENGVATDVGIELEVGATLQLNVITWAQLNLMACSALLSQHVWSCYLKCPTVVRKNFDTARLMHARPDGIQCCLRPAVLIILHPQVVACVCTHILSHPHH